MFSFFLFLITAFLGIFESYFSLGYAYWGASTFFSQYASLFGGFILLIGSFYYLFSPKNGFLVSCIGSMLISVLLIHFGYTVLVNYPFKKILSNIHYAFLTIPFVLPLFLSIFVSFLGYTGIGRNKYPKDWIFPLDKPIKGGIYLGFGTIIFLLFVFMLMVMGTGREVTKEYSAKVVKWEKDEIIATLDDYPAYSLMGTSEGIYTKLGKPEKIKVKVLFIKDFSQIRSEQILSINDLKVTEEEYSNFFITRMCGAEGYIKCDSPLAEKSPTD